MNESSSDVLRVTGVRKSFGGTSALAGVDLRIKSGEIHALVGGNGSGKSTLLKILAGVLPADDGTLELNDRTWDLTSFDSRDSHACGLRFVHQHPTVFPNLSVMDNLCVGGAYLVGPTGRIRWHSTRSRVREVLGRFGIDAGPDDVLGALSPAKRTMVEIARALQGLDVEDVSVLALDEPTAALARDEVELLLPMLQRFAQESGQSILFVSHRLDEVVAIANRVTVLRDGRQVATIEHDDVDKPTIVEAIVGRPLDTAVPEPALRDGNSQPVLRARGLSGGPVQPIDLEVHSGEVVGLAGPMGSGRSSVLRLIYGAMRIDSGDVQLDGQPLIIRDPKDAIAAGIGYVPEDRIGQAVLPSLSIADNLALVDARAYWSGIQQRGKERADAAKVIARFGIKASSPAAPMSSLSGGNQQKLVVARWLSRPTRLLLLDEPTQAVDVAARADLWRLIHEASGTGMGVLIASSDLEELAHLCHRVIILRQGRVAAELSGPRSVTEDEIGRVMLGVEAA